MRRPARLWLLRVFAAAALLLAFLAYLQPGLMVDLANQLWSCF